MAKKVFVSMRVCEGDLEKIDAERKALQKTQIKDVSRPDVVRHALNYYFKNRKRSNG